LTAVLAEAKGDADRCEVLEDLAGVC